MRWAKNLMKRMVYFSLIHWQIRNVWVHDSMKKENFKEKRKRINEKITGWYNKQNEFDANANYLFKIPLLGRCMKSLRNNEAWLRTIELEYICLKEKTVN